MQCDVIIVESLTTEQPAS